MTAVFSVYLRQFPAGKNVQIAGDIARRRRLLRTLNNEGGNANDDGSE